MNDNDLINSYREIREMYPLVTDTDAYQAYQLMQKSNVLRSYLDECAVDKSKYVTILKNEIDIVKSRKSIAGDPKNSTNGNRIAMASEEYKDAVNLYAEHKSSLDMIERQVEFLKNVSFQMYAVWENCKKNGERY